MTAETITVSDNEKELQSVLVNVIDPTKTVKMVSRGRGVKKPRYSIQVDAGAGKVISAVNIFEGDKEQSKKNEVNQKKAIYQD